MWSEATGKREKKGSKDEMSKLWNYSVSSGSHSGISYRAFQRMSRNAVEPTVCHYNKEGKEKNEERGYRTMRRNETFWTIDNVRKGEVRMSQFIRDRNG